MSIIQRINRLVQSRVGYAALQQQKSVSGLVVGLQGTPPYESLNSSVEIAPWPSAKTQPLLGSAYGRPHLVIANAEVKLYCVAYKGWCYSDECEPGYCYGLAQRHAGIEDFKAGRVTSWKDVQAELGLEREDD